MTDFDAYIETLVHHIDADPVLRLAHAVAWLDPLWKAFDEDEWDGGNPDDALPHVLHTLRRAFPQVYSDALVALGRGEDVDALICRAMQARGIPLDDIEFMPFGIPMPAYGVDLHDLDTLTAHPELRELLSAFDVIAVEGVMQVPDDAHRIAYRLAEAMDEADDPMWESVATALSWAFGFSGNSSVAHNHEEMCSFQPLSWDPDDVAFAVEIIEEAEELMQMAQTGLAYLHDNPTALDALRTHIHTLRRNNLKEGDPDVRQFEWPRPDRGGERDADREPELLQLRPDAA